MPKQDLTYPAQDGPFLLPGNDEAVGEWESAITTPETDVPAFAQEAAQGRWGLTQEALESGYPSARYNPGQALGQVRGPEMPRDEAIAGESWLATARGPRSYTDPLSASSAEQSELTADEVMMIVGQTPAASALHQLLASPKLRESMLAALLARPGRRAVRLRGSDIPLSRYLRLLERLFRTAADDRDRELGETTSARAHFPEMEIREVPRKGNAPASSSKALSPPDLDPPPVLTEEQREKALAARDGWMTFHHIALQGTSGQFEDPPTAERNASLIARKLVEYLMQQSGSYDYIGGDYLGDALQGAASKYDNVDKVVDKTVKIAFQARHGDASDIKWLTWRLATLPQAMGPDCEPPPRQDTRAGQSSAL